MELRGTLRSWNDEKGFGFIRPEQGGADVFVHISAMRGESRPAVGQIVFYVASKDGQGRLRAEHMRGEALGLDRPSIRRKRGSTVANAKPNREKPTRVRRNSDVGIQALPQKVLVLMGLCALPGSSVIALLLSHGVMWPLLVYVLLSTVSFFQYWSDKNSAQKGNWRTPESTLHLTGLLGGWPGALVAQQVFRHKTRKVDFQITFWAIVLLHQGFWLDWQLSGRVLGPMLKGWLPY